MATAILVANYAPKPNIVSNNNEVYPYLKAIPVETADYPLIVMGGSSLIAKTPPYSLKFEVLGTLWGQDDPNYHFRQENAQMIDCVWFKESSRGINMVGDNGKAIGHFMIHLDKHPITYECAMDYYCSSNYFIEQVKLGNGNLWTTYKECSNGQPQF